MVHGHDRGPTRRLEQRALQPVQLGLKQRAAGRAGDRRIQREQPQRPEIRGRVDGVVGAFRQLERGAHRRPVVVVAGQHDERELEAPQLLAYDRVLLAGAVIGEVAGDDDRVGRIRRSPQRIDGCGQRRRRRHRSAPVGADVGIGQLREQERTAHGRVSGPAPRSASSARSRPVFPVSITSSGSPSAVAARSAHARVAGVGRCASHTTRV